ncbi:DUF1707 SHOCT-like domain-containing protein [Rathayibacter soli]|uniref:DUF1707 SHOCT-like domain-containing protein n=1 Tax=Rathayibacter soli TaxID=3144168 RepID=UPI0027E3E102|nr:DUF1707 domain-containing protein [Glaciibacter superstes]
MIDFSDPATRNLRLSNAERDEAVAALDQFATEGRLTDAEAAERAASVRAATTRGDLAPVFADLPAGTTPSTGSHPLPPRSAHEAFAEPTEAAPGEKALRNGQYALAAIAPFVAVALFFLTGTLWGYSVAWLWFLLIPVAGILVYGAGGWDTRDRGRDRHRNRNR